MTDETSPTSDADPSAAGDNLLRSIARSRFEPVYAVAQQWRAECLEGGRSLIDPSAQAWTPVFTADLRHRFVESYDESARSFSEKLADQLNGAPQEVFLLTADLLYIHQLPLQNVSAARKLATIDEVGARAPSPFAVPPALRTPLELGIVNGGVGFNTNRYYLMALLVELADAWAKLPGQERRHLLDDPYAFKHFLVGLPQQRADSQRNALLFLLYPEQFEDITSNDHKRRIVTAFREHAGDSTDIDRQLAAVRQALTPELGEAFSWYAPAIQPRWTDPTPPPPESVDAVPEHTGAVTSTNQHAWIVRVKRDGTSAVTDALKRGDTRVFWPIEVEPGASFEEVKAALLQANPDMSQNAAGSQAGSLHRFVSRMAPGDFVVMPDKSDVYFGTVRGPASFDPDRQEWSRPVKWAKNASMARSELDSALYSRLRTLLTVSDVSELSAVIAGYVHTDGPVPPPPPGPEVVLPTIDDETATEWMLDRAWLQEIVDLLQAKKQVIFYGPPGTGKTYLARKLASHLTVAGGSDLVVQFHPSYAYEDFIEGYRPRVDANGTMVYELKPGPLKSLAEAARANPGEPYFLIIDEINRGNLAKIFGELYYLLEYRDSSLVLQYGDGSDDEFSLPSNLFIIGTMNTADRSIAVVDAAVRRRFYFVELSPTRPPIDGLLRTWLQRKGIDDKPARLLTALNRKLDDDDYAIGPSYLMTDGIGERREIERVWKHGIMPLLVEHFYGQPERVAAFQLDVIEREAGSNASLDPTP